VIGAGFENPEKASDALVTPATSSTTVAVRTTPEGGNLSRTSAMNVATSTTIVIHSSVLTWLLRGQPDLRPGQRVWVHGDDALLTEDTPASLCHD